MFNLVIRSLFLSFILTFYIFHASAQSDDPEKTIAILEKEKNYDSLISVLEHAIHYGDITRHKKILHLEKLIKIYLLNEEYANAAASSFKLISWLEKTDSVLQLAKAYDQKATAEYYLKNLTNAATCIEKSMQLHLKVKDTVGVFRNLIRIGIITQELNKTNEALGYYRHANTLSVNDHNLLSNLYDCFTVAFSDIKQYDSAMFYIRKSIAANKKEKEPNHDAIIHSYSSLAACYMDIHNYKSAIQYLDSTRNYDWSKTSEKTVSFILSNYYNSYFKLNDLENFNLYLKRYIDHHEKSYQKKVNTEIKELEVAYEKEKLLLNEQQQSKINQLNLQKMILVLVIILLILLTSVVVYVYVSTKNKTKIENDKIRIEQRLLRTQMNPHFILNTLAAIQTLVEDNQATKASNYLHDFARLMQITLENSVENFITVASELKALEKYLALQLMRFENEFDYKIQIEASLQTSEILIPPMILQPFVENAIHHGIRNLDKKGKISIEVNGHDDAITCIIDDNGRGIISTAGKPRDKQSLSTQIIRQRLEILKNELKREANVKIIDKKEKGESGVRVILTIPYTY